MFPKFTNRQVAHVLGISPRMVSKIRMGRKPQPDLSQITTEQLEGAKSQFPEKHILHAAEMKKTLKERKSERCISLREKHKGF